MAHQLSVPLLGFELVVPLKLLIVEPILFLGQELLLLPVKVLLVLWAFSTVSCLGVVTYIWFESTFLHFPFKILFFLSSLQLCQLSISIMLVAHHSLCGLLSYLSLSLLVGVIRLLLAYWCTVSLTTHQPSVLLLEVVIYIQSPFSRFGFSFQISLSRILVKSHNLRRIHGFIAPVGVKELIPISESVVDLNVGDWVGIELLRSLRLESPIVSRVTSGYSFIKIVEVSLIADACFSVLRPHV